MTLCLSPGKGMDSSPGESLLLKHVLFGKTDIVLGILETQPSVVSKLIFKQIFGSGRIGSFQNNVKKISEILNGFKNDFSLAGFLIYDRKAFIFVTSNWGALSFYNNMAGFKCQWEEENFPLDKTGSVKGEILDIPVRSGLFIGRRRDCARSEFNDMLSEFMLCKSAPECIVWEKTYEGKKTGLGVYIL
ncbi:MAG: hypothetical protein K6F84_07990 [Lachnospiraceae bacterium]|nr:hypothetical protein [Lachnospiraceae bacterium]